jgi:formylglycine-generating enzyme required for sulfatase activity
MNSSPRQYCVTCYETNSEFCLSSRLWLWSLLLLACLILWPQTAQAQRIALVVGNAAYTDRPLRNPVNDAALMQTTLSSLGFQVSVLRNADRKALLAGLRDFESKARNADVALFFYAGHGAQVGGSNYLIPLNAQINAEADVPDEAVDAASVLRRIEDARAKVGLVILDACRDNPYTGSSRSGARGLARMNVPTGTIVAYATAPGSTADDGAGRSNGVYTEQLARHLAQPGLDIKDVFDRTAQEVERITAGKQRPREEVGLRGRFVLKEGGQPPQVVATARVEPVPVPAPQAPSVPEPPTASPSAPGVVAVAPAVAPQQPLVSPPLSAPVPGQTIKDCPICPELVVVPTGRFTMGTALKANMYDWEKPVRDVSIFGFAIGKFEVTQGQWKAVMGSNPSQFNNCGDDCPVDNVSWDDAQAYIRKLNQISGKNFRLPSEAEWEYAARAGTRTRWSFGDNDSQIGQYAWIVDNSGGRTQKVGQKRPNAFGLHDTYGNVEEWVEDCWFADYVGAPSDERAWTSPCREDRRVLRGGHWSHLAVGSRSASRGGLDPKSRKPYIGLRLARRL